MSEFLMLYLPMPSLRDVRDLPAFPMRCPGLPMRFLCGIRLCFRCEMSGTCLCVANVVYRAGFGSPVLISGLR
eukprot:82011-Rhodomonas_salina.1